MPKTTRRRPRGTPLRLALLARDLYARELARIVGISEGRLHRYITGAVVPQADVAVRIAQAVVATVEDLWPSDEV